VVESPPRFTNVGCEGLALVKLHSDANDAQDHLAKAPESLPGAESQLAHHRFNNAARDAYYTCFQAAIAALLNEENFSRHPEDLWRMTLCK
jgi:hypothetical protein